ncbi:MAG: glycosyltransferase family 1 protein [Bacteroidota bacterium]
MKIGFDAKRAFQNFTGLGNFSRTLLDSLQTHFPQYEYHLYAPRLKQHPRTDFLFEERFSLHTTDSPFKSFWRSRGMLSDLQRDKIDLFHGLSHELPFGIHRQQTRSVVTIHDLIFYPHPEQYGAWDRRVYHRKFRYACQNADHVVAISESTRRDIEHYYGVDPARISVIYQTCSAHFYQETSFGERRAVAQKHSLPEQFFLYVGSVIERKNIGLIFEAIRNWPRRAEAPKLVVIGGGGSYYRKMKAEADLSPFRDRIIWLQDVAFSEFPAIYQQANALIYPSYYEGFGLPVLEACATGLPAITTTRSSLPEAGGAGSLYIEPDDVDALIEAMQRILHESDLREEMIQLGREHAAGFTAARAAAQYMEIYESLI